MPSRSKAKDTAICTAGGLVKVTRANITIGDSSGIIEATTANELFGFMNDI